MKTAARGEAMTPFPRSRLFTHFGVPFTPKASRRPMIYYAQAQERAHPVSPHLNI